MKRENWGCLPVGVVGGGRLEMWLVEVRWREGGVRMRGV